MWNWFYAFLSLRRRVTEPHLLLLQRILRAAGKRSQCRFGSSPCRQQRPCGYINVPLTKRERPRGSPLFGLDKRCSAVVLFRQDVLRIDLTGSIMAMRTVVTVVISRNKHGSVENRRRDSTNNRLTTNKQLGRSVHGVHSGRAWHCGHSRLSS